MDQYDMSFNQIPLIYPQMDKNYQEILIKLTLENVAIFISFFFTTNRW